MNSTFVARVASSFSKISFFLVVFALPAQDVKTPFGEPFHEGCCVNSQSIPRPTRVSRIQVPRSRLLEALHCATDNGFIEGSSELAKAFGNREQLAVAYYYGKYMGKEDQPSLTMAVYSADGKRGVLFDMAWESREYYVSNLSDLVRAPKQWRVGGIQGGIWSYTRLWYLAQEIGSRPRQMISYREIEQAKPAGCMVMGMDEKSWTPPPKKAGRNQEHGPS